MSGFEVRAIRGEDVVVKLLKLRNPRTKNEMGFDETLGQWKKTREKTTEPYFDMTTNQLEYKVRTMLTPVLRDLNNPQAKNDKPADLTNYYERARAGEVNASKPSIRLSGTEAGRGLANLVKTMKKDPKALKDFYREFGGEREVKHYIEAFRQIGTKIVFDESQWLNEQVKAKSSQYI